MGVQHQCQVKYIITVAQNGCFGAVMGDTLPQRFTADWNNACRMSASSEGGQISGSWGNGARIQAWSAIMRTLLLSNQVTKSSFYWFQQPVFIRKYGSGQSDHLSYKWPKWASSTGFADSAYRLEGAWSWSSAQLSWFRHLINGSLKGTGSWGMVCFIEPFDFEKVKSSHPNQQLFSTSLPVFCKRWWSDCLCGEGWEKTKLLLQLVDGLQVLFGQEETGSCLWCLHDPIQAKRKQIGGR